MQSFTSFPFRRRRRGSITPLAVLSLSLLLGMVALTVDGGMLMEDRRHAQATADAAALAAAADLFANYASNNGIDSKGTAQASALSTAAANGFDNDGVQSVVTINTSPQNYQGGPNAGKPLPAGYVEVIVQYNASRLFSGVFGTGTLPVQARAVARGQWAPMTDQMISLNETAKDAINVTGSANVNVHGGLLVNSSNSAAINVASTASLTASVMSLVGSLLGTVGNVVDAAENVLADLLRILFGSSEGVGAPALSATHVSTVSDPLRYLPDPNPAQLGLSVQSATQLNITSTPSNPLSPGIYQGGITISQGASVTLTPGIYYIQGGGLQVSDSSSTSSSLQVDGNTSGVMIYNDWQDNVNDVVSLKGNGSLQLAPLGSGGYQGLTIFQKRGTYGNPAPALTILGTGNTQITGTIYAAYSNVTLQNLSGTNLMGGQIVADTISANSKNYGIANIDPSGQPTARSRVFGLVE